MSSVLWRIWRGAGAGDRGAVWRVGLSREAVLKSRNEAGGRDARGKAAGGAAPERVLVIKHGALGDIVQGLDAFAMIREGRPADHIALLTSPPFVGLAGRMPWFDEVIRDERAGLLRLGETLRMRRVLRAGWDIVLDLQCSGRTAAYHRHLKSSPARWFGTAPGASDPYPDFTGVNNARRMTVGAEMAGGMAGVVAGLEWLGGTTSRGAAPGDGALVIVPGCSPAKPSKRWPAARYAELANLAAGRGMRVVIVGTGADRAAADAVLLDAPHCIDMIGRTELPELANVFARAAMVAGNDTGPVFLAARTGVPTLMVMGPDTDQSMSAPVGGRAGWIRKSPIGAVTAGQVMKALEEL